MSQPIPDLSQPPVANAPKADHPQFLRLDWWVRQLPSAAWTRIGLLLCALILIKLGVVFSLRKHIYENHWRVIPEPESWFNYLLFAVFVFLAILGLWTLATHCREKGPKTVRSANALLLSLGLLFVLLTFHTGDKNYLYPIMTRTLKWTSLGPYLSLDFFFRPPFLAAWILGYAFAYYLLARTGREIWTLHLTSFIAGAFASLYLRQLHFFPHELLVANSLGLACLLIWRRSETPATLAWFSVPTLWAISYLLLLRLVSAEVANLDLYFRLLFLATLGLFIAASLWARRHGFLTPWNRVAPFFFVSFLLLTNAYYPMARNYNNSLCLGLGFPHYFLSELLLALTLAGCAWVYHRIRPQSRFRWLDAVNLILITIAIVDLRVTQIMGVRLEWDVLTFGNSPIMMWRIAKPYLPGLLLGLSAVVLFYGVALHCLRSWFHYERPNASPAPLLPGERSLSPGPCFVLASFVLLAIVGWTIAGSDKAQSQSAVRLAVSTPVWSRALNPTLSREDLLKTMDQLGLVNPQRTAVKSPVGPPRDLNVLIVFMESSYNKYLSLFGSEYETQPLLSKYKQRMELFPNFFSDFASSIHARFATFTSLYPVRDYNAFTLHRINVKSLFEALHDNRYNCSLFYSSFFDYTGFGDFLKNRGIDELYDANNMPGARGAETVSWGLKEETTLAAIRKQIQKYSKTGERFCLTYVPAAPHYPYDNIPKQFRKFKKLDLNDYTPVYLNELLYMDWVISSIVDQLNDSGLLDHTLVIITNDHGEMLGGKDTHVGHGWAFTPELANTPLIIMDPQTPRYRVNYAVGSQVDFLPTLLDKLNLPLPSGELYQGRSLLCSENQSDRHIYLNTCQQFGVLCDNQIIVGDRDSAKTSGFQTTSFTFSNEGARTLFRECATTDTHSISIRSFDEFQENLLRNYSTYCKSVCSHKTAVEPKFPQTTSATARVSR